MTSRNNNNNSFSYSSVPVPHDRHEEEAQMREAIAASLGTTVDMVDQEQVRRNLGRETNVVAARRSRNISRLPLARGVFC